MSTQAGTEVWGLTGGAAAGKSAVARFFAEAGFAVLDADQVARELSQPGGRAHAWIQARWGTADRAELRKIVFSDPKARAELEAILHPLIREESERKIAELAAAKRKAGQISPDGKIRVIYEASLLVETGRHKAMHGLIVVEASIEERRSRLRARDQITPEVAEGILKAQLSDETRRQAATELLVNDGTLDELRAKVHELIARRGWK